MSRVVRRKHVLKEMYDDDLELPKENQEIVRVATSRGNNLHEVQSAKGEENFLVSMPNKFRNTVWVKRGDFLLIEPIEEGDKVKAEICKILTPEHIKEYTKAGVWPKLFTKKREHEAIEDNDDSDEDGGEFMVRNCNRQPQRKAADDDEDETSSSSSGDDD